MSINKDKLIEMLNESLNKEIGNNKMSKEIVSLLFSADKENLLNKKDVSLQWLHDTILEEYHKMKKEFPEPNFGSPLLEIGKKENPTYEEQLKNEIKKDVDSLRNEKILQKFDDIEKKLDKLIEFLKIDENVDNKPIEKKAPASAPLPSNHFLEVIVGDIHKFKGGLEEIQFNTKDITSRDYEKIKIITDTDIFYEDIIVVRRGQAIPFFNRLESWEGRNSGKFVLDLRVAGVYGTDFRAEKLNNDGIKETSYEKFYKERGTIETKKCKFNLRLIY